MGTRTLVLTDLVDSTRFVEAIGDARAAELWTRHDRVARDLLVAHGGREIDKSDGFLLLFDGPAAAVAFATDYHAALRGLGVAARVGVHHAPVLVRENPAADVARGAKPLEVEGVAKAVAARVMAVARGGQTLLTPAAVAASELADRVTSHGAYRLKGVAEPLELFEFVAAGEPPLAPPPDGPKAWRVRVHRVVEAVDEDADAVRPAEPIERCHGVP